MTQNYGWTRSNDLQSVRGEKPKVHELVYIAESLIKDGVSEAEMKIVSEKYAKTLLCSKVEITALRKVLSWKACERTSLILLLKRYQSYCTLDATNTGNRSRLARGERMPLTKTLFCQLAKVEGKAFAEQCQSVVDGDISLKDFVDKLLTVSELDANKALVSKTAKYKPSILENLMTTYWKVTLELPSALVPRTCKE